MQRWLLAINTFIKKINSVHESYYARKQLDPKRIEKKNVTRFAAGQKLEFLASISKKKQILHHEF